MTVPLGVIELLAEDGFSVTMTLQLEAWPTTTEVAHERLVDVVRRLTVMLDVVVVELLLWAELVVVYVALTEAVPAADERNVSVQVAVPTVVLGVRLH